jgi:hypothetical protein
MSKIIRAKWTEGMAHAVEHLLCKDKALNLNPNLTHEKRKEGRKERKSADMPKSLRARI